MTRSELAARITEFERGNRRREWTFMPFWIAGMVGIPLWIISFSPHSSLVGTLAIVALFAWIIGPGVFLARINRRRIRELELRCPKCDTSLAGHVGRLAVTTMFCSQCGAQIVEPNQGEQGVGGQPATPPRVGD